MDAFVKRLPAGHIVPDAPAEPWDAGEARASKRLKRGEERDDSYSDDSGESSSTEKRSQKGSPPTAKRPQKGSVSGLSETDQRQGNARVTEFENVLPPTLTDDEAFEEYKVLKSSKLQDDSLADGINEKTLPPWIRGKSSIYVDAFNLALDTVLEDESKLFTQEEHEIFNQWKTLGYEAQYLYVRLFLRKTAAWHRISRISSYSDISDPTAAIKALQIVRELPETASTRAKDEIPGIELETIDGGDAFTFADASENHIESVEEAASLMYLDELKALAKEVKVQGRVKADFIKSISRMGQQQTRLVMSSSSRQDSQSDNAQREESKRGGHHHLLSRISAIVGPCVRLSPLTFKLFERVHLVFYRSTEWTEKSLTTIILAKIARRNFPAYIVCRTSIIFSSRLGLLEFEAAIRLEAEVDNLLEVNAQQASARFAGVLDIFDKVYPRWKVLIAEEGEKEKLIYQAGEGMYLRRFSAAHSYTRIIHKAAFVFGKLKNHAKEHSLLSELLGQRLFHLARRGSWYQRKALLEEHYMALLEADAVSHDFEQQKKVWRGRAASTCEVGLQDPDCHLIHHHDLQKRLVKLERRLRVPRRLQHDFGHVRLAEAVEVSVQGIQLKRETVPRAGLQTSSSKTIWLDELDTGGECSVEAMCLSHFRSQGWKGYHAEGGIVRTLFAYLFYDIMFLYIPNVFQTAFQTCPLDLHTDAFFPARASEINRRLVEIANGEGERILREVWEREHERRTSVVGLDWDFEVEDLAELVGCFEAGALAALCKVMAQEYRQRGGGIPDLILWRAAAEAAGSRGEVMFAEVKSANDRLSDTQRLWIHVLAGAGVKVALCHAIAREVREVG